VPHVRPKGVQRVALALKIRHEASCLEELNYNCSRRQTRLGDSTRTGALQVEGLARLKKSTWLQATRSSRVEWCPHCCRSEEAEVF
jgi:hypothetical protein